MLRMRQFKLGLLALSSPLWLLSPPLQAADKPDFSGTWVLNDELSENPRDKMQEAMGNRRGGGFGGGGRSGGGGMGGGGMRGGMGGGRGGDPGAMSERMRALEEGVKVLKIIHQDPAFNIRYADDRERALFTDGRELVSELDQGLVEATANWKGGQKVVVKGEMLNGGKRSEIFELSEDGQQLLITTSMEGSGRMPKTSFRRVYDLVMDPAVGSADEATDPESVD